MGLRLVRPPQRNGAFIMGMTGTKKAIEQGDKGGSLKGKGTAADAKTKTPQNGGADDAGDDAEDEEEGTENRSGDEEDDEEDPEDDADDDKPLTRKEVQKEIDRVAAKVRRDERAKLKKEQEEADRQRQQEEDEKAGKFEDLYNKEKAATKSLQTQLETANEFVAMVNQMIEEEVSGWPREVRELDPGAEDDDPESVRRRAEWRDKTRALADRLRAGSRPPNTEGGRSSDNSSRRGVDTNPARSYVSGRYGRPKVGAQQ